MNTRQVKHTIRKWVETNIPNWSGLRGAHLIGAVTTMPDDAVFPVYKDVDVQLIFEPGSPLLKPIGPFPYHLEVFYEGLSIEGGLKLVQDYESPEAVLANPTIAHHLTVDSLLYDPGGWLHDLQGAVTREYPRRKWVLARVEYERKKQKEILAQRQLARAMSGIAGEMGVLGYSYTCIPALLSVVTLRAPTTGSRATLRVSETVAQYNRADLYEELLGVLGVGNARRPEKVAQRLREGAEAFDLAVAVRRSPHPFQHKLHKHLRPYFVEACASLLAEGYHREAALWLMAFYMSSIEVILADGPDTEKPTFAERRTELMHDLGVDTAEAVSARYERADKLYNEFFVLASEIASRHSGIVN